MQNLKLKVREGVDIESDIHKKRRRIAFVVAAVLQILPWLYETKVPRRRIRNSSLGGREYCNELLDPDSVTRFHETTFFWARPVFAVRKVRDSERKI